MPGDDDVRCALTALAEQAAPLPPLDAGPFLLAYRRARRRRSSARAAVSGLTVATVAVTTISLHSHDARRPETAPTLTQASPSTNSTARADVIVDGVAVSNLPRGWALPTPHPHTVALHPGTRTRLDVYVGENGRGGGCLLEVYRNSRWTPAAASHDVQQGHGADGGPAYNPVQTGDDRLGIVTWHDARGSVDHRTGWVVLDDHTFLVVSSSAWTEATLRGVLRSARLS
ncbi:MAG: hypothetical protein WCD35_04970 [Mycobacteriales bacterium]